MAINKINEARSYSKAPSVQSKIIPFGLVEPDATEKKSKPKKKREVFALEVTDAKKILDHFEKNECWLPYLLFVLCCNTGRRGGDIMKLKWKDFFNPKTGQFLDNIPSFMEDKTDKYTSPRINKACRCAIEKYIEKTGCDPSKDGYSEEIAMQHSGTWVGRTMSYSGYLKALKKASVECGIKYNVGTHSARKMFGMISMAIHPGDANSLETIQMFFNHSSKKITKRYIGDYKKKFDMYCDDFGEVFEDCVMGDKEFELASPSNVATYYLSNITSLIKAAYQAGRDNADNADPMAHVEVIKELVDMANEWKI